MNMLLASCTPKTNFLSTIQAKKRTVHYGGPILQELQCPEMLAKCKFCKFFAGADILLFD
jgi:hypothetical protein